MKKQRVISILAFIIMMMNIFSSFAAAEGVAETTEAVSETIEAVPETDQGVSLTASVAAYTNQYTYIRMAPYWTAQVVDEIASGIPITILDREYSYLYVEYDHSGTKRGYIPIDFTDATGYSWCSYNEYHRAYNSTSSAQNVYYGPSSSYASCGSIDADEGEVSNKPMIVLKTQGSYAYIQYTTNTSNTGSEYVRFKRAWIPTSKITITRPTSFTNSNYYYIKNAATESYLNLEGYSSGNTNGGNIDIWEYHGGYNQEWLFEAAASNGGTYTKISTNQGTNKRVLQVKEGSAIVGNNIELYTKSDPSKDQEFLVESAGSGKYYIRARCGSLYLTLGVMSDESGMGGDVYLTFPSNSDYNKWILEPAYKNGVDYAYTTTHITDSSQVVSNGINAKYNISSVPSVKTYNGTNLYLAQYTADGIALWNKPNKLITAAVNSSSMNVITVGTFYPLDTDDDFTLGITPHAVTNGCKSITIYYDTIIRYVNDPRSSHTLNDFEYVWRWTVAHEIGHTLGLDEAPSTASSSSIMSYSNGKTSTSATQKMDFAGVKKVYASK